MNGAEINEDTLRNMIITQNEKIRDIIDNVIARIDGDNDRDVSTHDV